MTDNTNVEPSVAPAAGPGRASLRLLRRSTGDRMVAGVSGGLGRHFDVDPIVFRAVFAVLAIFSLGTWLLVYTALWLIIPEEGTTQSIARRSFGDRMDQIREKINRGDKQTLVVLVLLGIAALVIVLTPLHWVLVIAAATAMLIAAVNRYMRTKDAPQDATPWWKRTPQGRAQEPGSVSVTKQTPPAPPTGGPGRA